jgi:predicted RNA binding protein YcfA (HicA-like mRNA interferase family)
VLRKLTGSGSVGTVVPNHENLKIGTLKSILELAEVKEEEFAKHQ